MQTPAASTRQLAAELAVRAAPGQPGREPVADVYAEAEETRRTLERISLEMQQRVADCFGTQAPPRER